VAETDPAPAGNEANSGSTGTVIAHGEVPFAILDDQRVIMARFRTTFKPQPAHSLSDPESTHWTLALDGHEFTVIGSDDDQPSWLPIKDSRARGGEDPLPASAHGQRHVVSYHYFYGHHLGSLSGPVTLSFDVHAMTVTVSKDLTFDSE
jgi:hypothetical protein